MFHTSNTKTNPLNTPKLVGFPMISHFFLDFLGVVGPPIPSSPSSPWRVHGASAQVPRDGHGPGDLDVTDVVQLFATRGVAGLRGSQG